MNIGKEIAERRAEIDAARVRGEGEVGIWFLLGSDLLLLSVPFSQSHLYGRANVFGDHDKVFENLRSHVPALQGREFLKTPRGRVSHFPDRGRFRILSSSTLLADAELVEKVKQEFRLNGKQVELVADEHYEIR